MFISLATLGDHPQEELVDSIWLQVRAQKRHQPNLVGYRSKRIFFQKRILLHFGELLNLLCLNMAISRVKKKTFLENWLATLMDFSFLFFFPEKTPLYELHSISFYAKVAKIHQKTKKKTITYPLLFFLFFFGYKQVHSSEFIFQHFISLFLPKTFGKSFDNFCILM